MTNSTPEQPQRASTPHHPVWPDKRIDDVEPRYSETGKAHLMKMIRDDERKPLFAAIAERDAEIERQRARADAAIEWANEQLQEGQGWEPVNPVSMANDEYADAEIMLCYRRTRESKE